MAAWIVPRPSDVCAPCSVGMKNVKVVGWRKILPWIQTIAWEAKKCVVESESNVEPLRADALIQESEFEASVEILAY